MNYGYLHRGRVIEYEPVTGGYIVEIPTLAPTRRMGPFPSLVANLPVGQRVLLASLATSRDELVILGRNPGVAPTMSEIPGLVAALNGKADDSEITDILISLGSLDNRLDVVEPIVSSHTGTLASHTGTLGTYGTRLTTLEGHNFPDPVANAGARPTTGLFDGKAIFRTDKGFLEFYDLAATKWRVRSVVPVAALADITDPLTDQVVFLTADRSFYRYTGLAWARLITGIRVFEGVQATSTITMTTTLQDLASVSFTTVGSSSVITVSVAIDGSSTGITDIGIGRCLVNATLLAGELHWGPIGRATYARAWTTTLASGSHVVKLQGREFGSSADSFTTHADHTNLVVTVYDA